jgi:hypothetical protein
MSSNVIEGDVNERFLKNKLYGKRVMLPYSQLLELSPYLG